MQTENRREYVLGAFLVRFALGMLFFVMGLNKFIKGAADVSAQIAGMFKDSWLPAVMVAPYTHVLPYMEVSVGVLLLLGLFRGVAVTLGSLLMLSLTFGMMVAGNGPIIATNMTYVLMFAVALFTSPWDRIKLDSLLFRRSSR